MGIFDGNKSKQIDYLEEERNKMWGRVIGLERLTKDLEKEIQKKASDSEKEAIQSSKKAAEFKNKTEQRFIESTLIVSRINSELESIQKFKEDITKSRDEVSIQKSDIIEIKERLLESETEYQEKLENLDSRIITIDEFLEKYPDLETNIEEVDEYISKIEENLEKSGVSLLALNKRKKEIDDLHLGIFGYVQKSEGNVETLKVKGLKDELDSVYVKLSNDIIEASENIDQIKTSYSTNYKEFEKDHKDKYNAITEEIANLLPNALTAGLSAAFSSKKEDEVESSKILLNRFSQGIYLLIGVSFIPFILSAIFIYQGVSLEETIIRIPRLVLAIIPMYIPVLWFTYSANKKLNLSKRLIEEYAHKEVLSKTYEGFSKQIEGIADNKQSEELKFRLLANFLQASSENPGKLISNYEASDHPIMEALEQSYKFQNAFDRLEGIPGLGKIAAILGTKAKKKLDDRNGKINEALAKEVPDVELDNDAA